VFIAAKRDEKTRGADFGSAACSVCVFWGNSGEKRAG
jgi:hypothetical protein